MKTKFNGILTLLLAFIVQLSVAQEKTISGIVSDESGPLPGVSILKKGSNKGTETDFYGKYTIKAKKGDVLIFSFIGMKTVEITVGSSSKVDISLEGDNILDEVVVVGYGTSTKKTYTGTAKVVKAEELEKKSVSNISQALAGEIAGVNVINTSGQPGTVATIRIRGFGSVNGNRSPLYVVDGVPFSGTLNSINPADIESTTILKDATATSIYGSRGANGVILITTKSGKNGKSNIEVDIKTGVNFRHLPDYQTIKSADEYLELSWLALKNSKPANSSLTDIDYANANLFGKKGIDSDYNYFNTSDVTQIIDPATGRVRSSAIKKYTPENWRDYAFQSSIRTESNLKMSGGNDKTRYFSSFGYLDDVGYISNSNFRRYSTRLNITHSPVSWITANANINYSYGKITDNGQGSSSNSVFWFVNEIPSIYPLFLRDANGDFIPDDKYGGNQYDYGDKLGYSRGFGLGTNAIGDAIYNLSQNVRHTFSGNFSAKFNLFEGATFETRYGYQIFNRLDNSVNNPFYGALSTSKGRLSQTKDARNTKNFLNMLKYVKSFDSHNFEVLLAHESNESIYENSSVQKEKVVNLNNSLTSLNNYIVASNPATGYITERALESYFGQINYGYESKYYLTASARRDGSSRFANKKWGTFGAVGVSWLISKEDFMQNASFVNSLKFKASYGLTGDQAGVGLYSGQNTYRISNLGGEIALGVNAIQDPNLTWETSKLFQVGSEFSLFNNRINGSVDYYIKNTEDLIFERRIGPSIGDALIKTNDGKLRNAGLEFDLNGLIINNDDFKLDLTLNGEVLNNELTKMPIAPSTGKEKTLDIAGNYGRSKGHSIYDFYLAEWAGVNPDTGVATWNRYYHDANNNNILDTGEGIRSLTEYQTKNPENSISKTTTEKYEEATQKYIGKSVIPAIRGAFKLNAKIYDFDLSTQFGYSLGGYSYDSRYAGLMSNAKIGSTNYSIDVRNSWKKPGDFTDIPKLQSDLNPNVNSASTRFVTSSDYLSLNNVRLSYSIPRMFIQNSGVSSVKIWISGDNLFLLSARKGFDPRMRETGSNSAYNYSLLSTFSLGVRVKL